MNTSITSRHFQASDKLKAYITKMVNDLECLIDNIIDCNVILSYDARQMKTVEISFHVNAETLISEDTSDNFYKSADKAGEKLQEKIKKLINRQQN